VVRFSYRMVPEVYQVFWAGMAAGEFINDAAIAAGSYRRQGSRWLALGGGVRPRRGSGARPVRYPTGWVVMPTTAPRATSPCASIAAHPMTYPKPTGRRHAI